MSIDIDPAAQARLTHREVRAGNRDGEVTKVVVASRHYAAPRAQVWDAISNPERIPRWFLPVTGELRLGGRYQLEGNAGGVIERCEPPELIAVTWEIFGATSWVEVQLGEDDAGTLLQLRHEARIDQHWEQFGPGAVGVGWDLGLQGLRLHLDTGAAVDPQGFEAWSASAAGTEFITACSHDWAEADVAGGADRQTARAAGAQVTAFFTGAGPDGGAGDGGS